MSDLILKHIEGGVLTLTFNRPDKKNALTRDMYTALSDALGQGAADEAVRVAVFQGAVDVFTAGNDLIDFLSSPPDAGKGDDEPVFRFLHALQSFPKPVVAAVCGPAVGWVPPCCCIAIWSMRATTLRSACPSSTWVRAPRPVPACCCRT